ncbi:MAG: DUF2071 domain-containing protein [Acidimicrobiales bacterium]
MTESPYGPNCPISVDRAIMVQRWDKLTFLHWAYDPEEVQRLLPPGLRVQTFDQLAWVALVPFAMQVRAARGGPVPWLSHFCETNVRTYVTAPDGTSGVWFFSLEAARSPAVLAARFGYQLPYYWADMSLDEAGDRIRYRSRRRLPGPRGVSSDVDIRVGAQIPPDELSPKEHFLTARWRLYSPRRGGTLRWALAEHGPWPLHRAEVVGLDDQLLAASGLSAPVGDPLVHWSPGVEVGIGLPEEAVR